MSRSLGVADSKADIDEGSITGITALGTSTSALIGFYGVTRVAQPTGATQATIVATFITISSGFGFTSSDQVVSGIAAIHQIQHVLKTLGLWRGS